MFLPVYLFVIIPAPWYRKHGSTPKIAAFVEGVTAAAIGAITGRGLRDWRRRHSRYPDGLDRDRSAF